MNLPGFAQEDSQVTRPEDLEQRVHVIGTPTPQQNTDPANVPAVNPAQLTEDEKAIHDIEAERLKGAETAQKLEAAKNAIVEPVFDAPEELRKLGYDSINGAALMDVRVVKVVQKMMAQNNFKNVSLDEVKAMIIEKAKGSPMEGFLNDHPRVTHTFAEILKDEKAMASIIGIFLRRDDLKKYACFWLALMIIAMIIKKKTFKKSWPSSKRFLMSMLVSICVTLTSFTIFYNIFSAELSPTAKIIVKNWRRRNLKI